MNLLELRERLTGLGIHPDSYSIGSFDDDRPALLTFGGKWIVSVSERGEFGDYRTFASESEACAYFLQQMDAKTFQPKIE
ncbi:hypothetical protein EF888_03955 [Silicimonas algicola]|uniref:hypothetical protein n=1 Tax=Silicimonas algicola TaxID=1826607 RepID=UPI000F858E9D|nr:hypothetical protein [Silicimonas algicola]AZQ66358.1 hypothetical protein EF888_03955 [Silicimonas algicola]